jgi:hypothetical protein
LQCSLLVPTVPACFRSTIPCPASRWCAPTAVDWLSFLRWVLPVPRCRRRISLGHRTSRQHLINQRLLDRKLRRGPRHLRRPHRHPAARQCRRCLISRRRRQLRVRSCRQQPVRTRARRPRLGSGQWRQDHRPPPVPCPAGRDRTSRCDRCPSVPACQPRRRLGRSPCRPALPCRLAAQYSVQRARRVLCR